MTRLEQDMHRAHEAIARGELDTARRIVLNRLDEIERIAPPRRDNHGSWNWGPHAWTAWYLTTGAERARQLLLDYIDGQLGDHGLWGLEIWSRVYTWPLADLLILWNHATDPELKRRVRVLLHAHLAALVLTTDADGYVVAPGMRSPTGSDTVWYSRVVAEALGFPSAPWVRRPRRLWGWYHRVMDHLDLCAILGPARREIFRRHVLHGTHAERIVAILDGLGVRMRTGVHVARNAAGEVWSWAEQPLHGSQPPTLAASRVGGRAYDLAPWPKTYRGEHGGRLGDQVRCWWDADAARVRVVAPGFVERRGAEPRRIEAEIPTPVEPPLYRVVLNNTGAEHAP